MIFLDFISLFRLWGIFVPLFFLFVFLGFPLIGGNDGLFGILGCPGELEIYRICFQLAPTSHIIGNSFFWIPGGILIGIFGNRCHSHLPLRAETSYIRDLSYF